MEVVVIIPGAPQGKGRHRTRVIHPKAGGKAFATQYADPKTKAYEGVIKTLAMVEMAGQEPIKGPVHLALISRILPPQSWPAWKREAAVRGQILPDTKPDPDNIKKAVMDGFNGVVWVDDCQVVSYVHRKEYHESPAVLAKITTRLEASSRITKRNELPERQPFVSKETSNGTTA